MKKVYDAPVMEKLILREAFCAQLNVSGFGDVEVDEDFGTDGWIEDLG